MRDEAERRFWRGAWESVPAEVASEHGIERRDFGPVQATIVASLPGSRMLNLVLGASEPGAVVDGHLAETLAWVDSRGVGACIPVTPDRPETDAAEECLRANEYEQGYAWMKFARDAHPPRFAAPEAVEVVELTGGEDEPFGMIAATGFGLPYWASTLFARLPGRADWYCYVARVDGVAQACAAMLVHEGAAEFGIAATLEPARGLGCQQALLHRRIVDAAAAGCHSLTVETGERIPGQPSPSYRNILRAGFEESYLRPNWQRSS
jgi:GNAT superfamily N-acetyltransferase